MKKFILVLNIVASILVPLSTQVVYASPEGFLQNTAANSPFSTEAQSKTTLPELVGKIIGIALSLLAAIFVLLMIYAGFKWMMARGEADDVKKAKETMINAVIGLVIIVLSYAITKFVVAGLTKSIK